METTRNAEVSWSGDLTSGSGTINYVSSGAFSRLPVTWASRTEEHNGRTSPEGVLIDLPLPHREIASIVGSTRESVTVRLNALKRAGIIDFVDRKILIKTPAAPAVI